VRAIRGHTDEVAALCFNPDGRRLATASHDRTVKLWDAATGQEILTLKGHAGEVAALAFSRDGLHLASAGMDHMIRIWDAAPLAPPKKEIVEVPLLGPADSDNTRIDPKRKQ
jgi:WD40 repeat protein